MKRQNFGLKSKLQIGCGLNFEFSNFLFIYLFIYLFWLLLKKYYYLTENDLMIRQIKNLNVN